jgi:hypothetical protein
VIPLGKEAQDKQRYQVGRQNRRQIESRPAKIEKEIGSTFSSYDHLCTGMRSEAFSLMFKK